MSLCYELAGGAIPWFLKLFAQNGGVLPPKKVATCFTLANRSSRGKFDGIHLASLERTGQI